MSNKTKLITILVFAFIALGYCWHTRNSGLPNNLSGKWQAVFLTDGQVYFGKLENENRKFAKLKEVYYLKISAGLQQSSGPEALSGKNLNLIRLGGEAHGPEGEMYISREQILFIENLKENSAVVQAIFNNQH